MQEHFPAKYIDDIAKVSIGQNYFSPVWEEVTARIGAVHGLLDIGCGNGIFSGEAKARTGCILYGVDGSDYALQQAQSVGFEQLEHIDDFNIDRLPFESEQFDFCLCKDLLEHLLHPQFVLTEAARVLKQEGYLLVHVPNHFTLQGRLRFLFDNDIDTYHYFPGAKRWDFPHIRFFTHESLLELLASYGFKAVMDLSHHFPAIPYGRYVLPLNPMRRWIVQKFPSQFAAGFTLLVQKHSGASRT